MTEQPQPGVPVLAMHAVRKLLDHVLSAACVLLFAVLVITVTWQVFSRQVIGDPSEWSEALAKYVFVWLGMFGAALVFSERGHISVDLLLRKLAPGAQRTVAILIQSIVIAFAVLAFVWGGVRMSVLAWNQDLTVLPGHLGPLYLVMPITGLIIVFYALYHMTELLRGEEPAIAADNSTETSEER